MSFPKWIDPKINITNLLALCGLVIGVVVGWTEMRADNRRQDDRLAAQEQVIADLRTHISTIANELRVSLREVKDRSDTILEKLVDKQQATTERVVRVETKVDEVLKAINPTTKRM